MVELLLLYACLTLCTVFSMRALVATTETSSNTGIVEDILRNEKSNFLRMEYLF